MGLKITRNQGEMKMEKKRMRVAHDGGGHTSGVEEGGETGEVNWMANVDKKEGPE